MDNTNIALAIEALGYDEKTIHINKHIECHFNILRNTFLSKFHKTTEGVGSKFEGLGGGTYSTKESRNTIDYDYVNNFTAIQMRLPKLTETGLQWVKETISVERDLAIIPCPDFPGYVRIRLLKSKFSFPFIPNKFFCSNPEPLKPSEAGPLKTLQNGPALSYYKFVGSDNTKEDIVHCLLYKSWPIEANEWLNRNKPKNWPSKKLIEQIKSKGFTIAPVGHYDCKYKEWQWRIGIRGEKELLSNLNKTQILCFVALKLILKGDIQHIHKDALSSFHMKNIIFWCAEQESCQWTMENFEICLKMCIKRLVKYLKCKKFPHYFIEDRNLINSKTSELTEEIVKALTKYSDNILRILSLNAFDKLRKFTNFKAELLDYTKPGSIIGVLVLLYLEQFSYFYTDPNSLWQTYEGHSSSTNLKNAKHILSVLMETKRHFTRPHIAYAKNMLGLLYYSRYKEKSCRNDYLKAMELLRSSLTFELISLKFRVATFYYMENEFDECLWVCDDLLRNPRKYESIKDKVHRAQVVTFNILSLLDIIIDVNHLNLLREKILAIFYDKCMSEKCGDGRHIQDELILSSIMNLHKLHEGDVNKLPELDVLNILFVPDALLLAFENFTTLVFRDMSFNVPYLASEKWAVPNVIHYELLSVKRCHPGSHIYGIYVDPMLICLVLKLLCFQKTKNFTQRDVVLSNLLNYTNTYFKLSHNAQSVSPERSHSLPLYRVYNIAAYCCIKAKRYEMASHYIFNSFKSYANAKNTASGYIRCVCAILNNICINEDIFYTSIAL